MYSMIKLNRVGIHNVISSKENTSYGLKKKKKIGPMYFSFQCIFANEVDSNTVTLYFFTISKIRN